MEYQIVRQKIKDFIIDKFMNGEGNIEDEEQLFESGIIDSMGFMKLLAFIRKAFDIPLEISEFTVESGTINGIMKVIAGKIEMNR